MTQLTRRSFATFTLLVALACLSCHREPEVTPEQQRQLEILRTAAYQTLERILGRPLTEDERACVVIRLVDGKLDSHVDEPLAGRVKARQDELQRMRPPTTSH